MNQNSTINWAPSAAYQNRNKVLKYTPKADLINEVKAAQSALESYDKELEATNADAMSKADLYSEYERLVTLYESVTAATPEAANTPAEPAVDNKVKSVSDAPKGAEKRNNRVDAQDRLDRYTAELKEKEALLAANQFPTKDDRKACVKRVASLKRKIARANRALERVVK